MSDVQLKDVGHENALSRGELLAASAIAQFYTFASRCMDWAKTTRSTQERAVYVQMGLQWLAAGARLQTCLQFKSSQDVSLKPAMEKSAQKAATLDVELGAHHSHVQPDHVRLIQDRASNIGGLHDTTEE